MKGLAPRLRFILNFRDFSIIDYTGASLTHHCDHEVSTCIINDCMILLYAKLTICYSIKVTISYDAQVTDTHRTTAMIKIV